MFAIETKSMKYLSLFANAGLVREVEKFLLRPRESISRVREERAMKHQQINVDVSSMVFTACSYLVLAGAVWIFLRLFQACFWLPRHLKKQNDVQQMLRDKVDSYEKYILECEERERGLIIEGEDTERKDPAETKRWKERRECLEMLKRELKRLQEGGEIRDWDYLLEEDENEEEEEDEEEKEQRRNEEKEEDEDEEEEEEEKEEENEEICIDRRTKSDDNRENFLMELDKDEDERIERQVEDKKDK